MQTDKKIYIGLGILLLIGGLIYLQSRKSQEEASQRTASAAAVSLPQFKVPGDVAEKITKVVVKEKDKPEVVLELRGEDWWLNQPISALANKTNVRSLIDNLKTLDVKDAINDTPEAPAMYKQYDLEGEETLHVTAFQGDNGTETVFDAYFGKSGTRGQMARLADKPGIWVVKGFSSFQFTRQTKDWRERSILKFEDQNVVSIALDNSEGKFSFSKNGDVWSGTRNNAKIANLDPEKVKDMLRAFRALNAEDFADDKKDNPAEVGLGAKPTATIAIVLKDDGGSIRLVVGDTSSGSSRYAKKDGDDMVYIVGTWAAEWATAKIDKFVKSDNASDDSSARPVDTHTFDFGGPPQGDDGDDDHFH